MKRCSRQAAALSWILVLLSLLGSGSPAFATGGGLAALEKRVAALERQVNALTAENASLRADLAVVQKNSVLALNGRLKLTQHNGYKTALFTGVNVQVVNGLGKTDTLNGLGNLIVGYNAPREGAYELWEVCSKGEYHNQAKCEANRGVWAVNHKSGSHNIVGGDNNAYSSVGGLVVGFDNVINGRFASVSAGRDNSASGFVSSASGGWYNRAWVDYGSVCGGYGNKTSGLFSSVSGGYYNEARGDFSGVSGGFDNTATGNLSSVTGGFGNTARGELSGVSGGNGVTAIGEYSWAAGKLCQPGPGGSCQVNPRPR